MNYIDNTNILQGCLQPNHIFRYLFLIEQLFGYIKVVKIPSKWKSQIVTGFLCLVA